ncbi:hypothetical protein NIES2100_14350 [Calothrix sp. NIES-2100]|uniref:hypothetical protein n=1 Tax=Calothrix sp. NIES-2100 TaxID=1954172 RepID=UPI000B5DFD9A|nr:hypothetical protein NIES2100_14350 [Calothrix sp. NIES-2100]
MMKPFVVYKKKPLSVQDLLKLITSLEKLAVEKLTCEPSYYFLRWTHKVSRDWKKAPIEECFPMIEGQMFNHYYELRWKYKRQDVYEVLLLSKDSDEVLISSIAKDYPDFAPVGEHWHTQDRDAHLHSPTETRFPKGFPDKKSDIAQRYFIDKQTSTVHFVALTIKQ